MARVITPGREKHPKTMQLHPQVRYRCIPGWGEAGTAPTRRARWRRCQGFPTTRSICTPSMPA
uniref:Uncharacterized protein n=1 Tax=Aquila chrysaetos chrysaetos TaxID=223781 RepID=A0A663DJP1_AQUCH